MSSTTCLGEEPKICREEQLGCNRGRRGGRGETEKGGAEGEEREEWRKRRGKSGGRGEGGVEGEERRRRCRGRNRRRGRQERSRSGGRSEHKANEVMRSTGVDKIRPTDWRSPAL